MQVQEKSTQTKRSKINQLQKTIEYKANEQKTQYLS